MDIELTDSDVESNMAHILGTMSKIRLEALGHNDISDEQKDEYLHSAYRLASCIEPVVSEKTFDRMKKITDAMKKDGRILGYDPFQASYWARKNPDFKKTLELVTIGTLKDRLVSMDEEHHVLQAIKYLSVRDSDFAEKERVYSTILPYNKMQNFEEGPLRRMAGKLFGYSVNADNNGATLKVKDRLTLDQAEDVVKNAAESGYLNAELLVMAGNGVDVDKRLKGSITNSHSINPKDDLSSVEEKFLRTWPLSYPILGILGEDTQKHIQEHFGGELFSAKDATVLAFLSDVVPGASLFTYGYWGDNTIWAIAAGYYFLANAGIKFWRCLNESDPVVKGNLHGWLASFPVDFYLKRREKTLNERRNVYSVDVPLAKVLEATGKTASMEATGFFGGLALTDIGKEAEENLVAGPGNFHSFGKKLDEFLLQYAKSVDVSQLKTYKERQRSSYSLYNLHGINGYDKFSQMAFMPNRRYVLSLISKAGKNYDPKSIAGILSADLFDDPKADTTAKLREAEKLYDPLFTRLRRYDSRELTADLESMG